LTEFRYFKEIVETNQIRLKLNSTPLQVREEGQKDFEDLKTKIETDLNIGTKTEITETRDSLYEEKQILDSKEKLTLEEQEELQKIEKYESYLRQQERRLNGEVVLENTTDIGTVNVRGRNKDIEIAEKDAGIEYPRELIFVENAKDKKGQIILPHDDYDTVYVIDDNYNIEFIKSHAEKQQLEREPSRPYYIKKDGKTIIYVDHFSGGSGTQSDPYIIETELEFETLMDGSRTTAYFKLANDLDFEGYTFTNDYITYDFAGEIDGDGHKISNFSWIISATDEYTPFARYWRGTMKNLFWDNFSITAEDPYYQHVGFFDGFYDNFSVYPYILNCMFKGYVKAYRYAGVINGSILNYLTIRNCAFIVDIEITNRFGGTLISNGGDVEDFTLENSYMVSNTYGSSTLFNDTIGYNLNLPETTVSGYYVNDTTDDFYTNIASVPLLTDTEMKDESNYTGFDFTNTWTIDSSVNDGYPILQIFYSAPSIPSGSSETTVLISSESIGFKSVAGGAETALEVKAEGSGGVAFKSAVGSSETSILISSDSSGMKKARSPPVENEAEILVQAEASGHKNITGSNESSISITNESLGQKSALLSSESNINIITESFGQKLAQNNSESSIVITSEGQGIQEIINSGASQTNVLVASEGLISSSKSGSAEAFLSINNESDGLKAVSSASETTEITTVEGLGEKLSLSESESTVTIDADGNYSLHYKGSSESNIGINTEQVYTTAKKNSSESQININTESAGQKANSSFSESIASINTEGLGFTNFVGAEESSINIISAGEKLKSSSSESETSVNISNISAGKKLSFNSNETNVIINLESENYKRVSGSSEANVSVSQEGLGSGILGGASTASVNISTEQKGLKQAEDDVETQIAISTESEYYKTASGFGETTTSILTEGSGKAIVAFSGSSETSITINLESSGKKFAQSNSETSVNINTETDSKKSSDSSSETSIAIDVETDSIKISSDSSNATIIINIESSGIKDNKVSSETIINTLSEGSGFKINTSSEESNISIIPESNYYKLVSDFADTQILIGSEARGTKGQGSSLRLVLIKLNGRYEVLTNKVIIYNRNNRLKILNPKNKVVIL